jgi:hypothetical protein
VSETTDMTTGHVRELLIAATAIRATRALNHSLGEAIAEWLDLEAHMLTIRRDGTSTEGHTFHALKIARAINGTAT